VRNDENVFLQSKHLHLIRENPFSLKPDQQRAWHLQNQELPFETVSKEMLTVPALSVASHEIVVEGGAFSNKHQKQRLEPGGPNALVIRFGP
jgi:hypothetical protein